MYNRIKQFVPAAQQFDGTAGKGLVKFNQRTGTKIARISLVMGSESKNYEIAIMDSDGDKYLIRKATGVTDQNVNIFGEIAVGGDEWLVVTTGSATSAMKLVIIYEV